MPNRIIREALLTSPKVAKLKFDNRWLYVGLLLCADDYGRIEYTSDKLLNAKIFPMDDIRDSDISRWIAECEKAGLLLTYEMNSIRYIQLHNFKQQVRSDSKCPAPPDNGPCVADAKQMLSKGKTNDHLGVGVVLGVVEGEGVGVKAPAQAGFVDYPKKWQEVQKAAEVIGYQMSQQEAENFLAKHEAKGWKDGKTPILDWRKVLTVWKNFPKRKTGGDPSWMTEKPEKPFKFGGKEM